MPQPIAGRAPVKLVTWLVLKLGLTNFGGLAVHIADDASGGRIAVAG